MQLHRSYAPSQHYCRAFHCALHASSVAWRHCGSFAFIGSNSAAATDERTLAHCCDDGRNDWVTSNEYVASIIALYFIVLLTRAAGLLGINSAASVGISLVLLATVFVVSLAI